MPVPEVPAISTERPSAPRPRRTGRGKLLRGLLITLLVVLGIVAIRPWSYWDELLSDRRSSRMNDVIITPPDHRPHDPLVTQTKTITPAPALNAGLAKLKESVALIEADGPLGREVIGSAFVLTPQGEVVTCLHVISRATSAVVRLSDGRVFDVAGYAAVDPANDLALLQLKEPPSSLKPVVLAETPPTQLTPVIAWGHPQGIEFSPFDGKVSRLIDSSQLPGGLQKFVRELTGGDTEQTWIQHTAKLSEGNSGGPLANDQGEVIGLNMWVDRQSDYSYALPVAALKNLSNLRLPEVQPLERFAASDARVRDATWQTSAQKLRKLADEARATKWQVHEWSDYSRLQHLAWGVTLANVPEHFTTKSELGDRLDELVKEADRVAAQLHQHAWNDGGQIIVLNEFAEKEVTRAGAGVVFFGTVQRVVEGRKQERALLVKLAGFEQMLLVPLSGELNAPATGSQCLFVGVNDRGRTVRYGDNPLQPIVASVIIAPLIVPLEK
ncbi:S1 family peptidase [Anatilimnocola aggregata]|nr:serine protease [Anatilimnocola aggregata]